MGKKNKLTKLSLARTQSDIRTIAQHKIQYLGIVNPNFGLFPEDLQVAEFVVDCKKTYGFPTHVFTSTTRKNLDRLKKIAQLFRDAGITTSWEVPVQTLDETAMAKIHRKQDINDYVSLIEFMNKAGINSYVEYIWPLPGKTLDSFKNGIAQLCRWDSHVIFVYPFTFTNNIGMESLQTEYGIEILPSHKSYSEDKFVIKTNEVSYEDNQAGCRYVLAALVLYSLRALFMTSCHLDSHGIENYRNLFDKFVQFVLSKYEPATHPYVAYMNQGISVNEEVLNPVVYALLHTDIQWFDQLLFEFVSAQTWWQVIIARVNDMLGIKADFNSNRVEINHYQGQTVLDKTVTLEASLFECTFAFINLFDHLPEWRDATQPVSHLKNRSTPLHNPTDLSPRYSA